MDGDHGPYRSPDGSVRPRPPLPQPPMNPNFHLLNPNLYDHEHDANRFFVQNPNFPAQNPNSLPVQHPNYYFPNPSNLSAQNPNFPVRNPNYTARAPSYSPSHPTFAPQSPGHHVASQWEAVFQTRTSLRSPEQLVVRARREGLLLDMELAGMITNQVDAALRLSRDAFSGKNCSAVISPISIQVLLGMAAAGVAAPGREDLLRFLGGRSIEDLSSFASEVVGHVFEDRSCIGGPKLSMANGAWTEKSMTLKPAFKHALEDGYKTDVIKLVDFRNDSDQVVSQVNEWAAKATNGLINNVVSSNDINNFTFLVLANAVYFKGAWYEKFNVCKTKEHDFYLPNGASVRVPFMTSKKDQSIGTYKGFKVLQLPYEFGRDWERRYSMCFFLPEERDGLHDLIERACSEPGFLSNHIPAGTKMVGEFRIPKFKISSRFDDVASLLAKLGVPALGNMSEVAEGAEIISAPILHQAIVEVNEEGTEAAALTAMSGIPGCSRMMLKCVDFIADRPFMFVIREDITGVVLFIGQVLNPKDE